ncbi:MAG: hypothetical protein KO206_06075 [Methanomicrobiaceae archaeon]|nr:hypothetical protein [Methanomicrobiaceae archaeon]
MMGWGHDPRGMLLAKMLQYLDEDQTRTLIVRIIDSRIRMKEHLIEHMQEKIETYQMARTMIEQGRRKG